MDTQTFNMHMEQVIKQTAPLQDHKEFEAVATCIIRHGDYSMIPTLMRICKDHASQYGIDLEQSSRETLVNKAKEYALNGDRLWNFKTTYAFNIMHEQEVLQGYLLKHLNSCMDILTGKIEPTSLMILEKFGDVYNYCILLYALNQDDECGIVI